LTVHAHCWSLLDRHIGKDAVLQNIVVFWRAVINWHCFGKHKHEGVAGGNGPGNRDSPGHEALEQSLQTAVRDSLHNARPDIIDDLSTSDLICPPLLIPGLRSIVQRAKQTVNVQAHRSRTILAPVDIDIVMMILDVIDRNPEAELAAKHADTRNMMLAFGWVAPDAYWTGRCNRLHRMVTEIKGVLQKEGEVNLQEFCLGMEKLVQNRHCTFSETENCLRRLQYFRECFKKAGETMDIKRKREEE
jgi:hypothetical protein